MLDIRSSYHLHDDVTVTISVDAETLFNHLDDPRQLGSHMEKPSWRTAGATMRYAVDQGEGRQVGSEIQLADRIPGMSLHLRERVSSTHRRDGKSGRPSVCHDCLSSALIAWASRLRRRERNPDYGFSLTTMQVRGGELYCGAV